MPHYLIGSVALVVPLVLCACKSSSTDDCSSSAAGSGQISGALSGKPFDQVSASYLIGMPDDPVHSRVFFVFDQPVSCCDVLDPGWDTQIADGTMAVEIKLIGRDPGTYPVATGPSAGQGQASVNWTLSSTSGVPAETGAIAGSASLVSVGETSTGSFDLTFPDGQVTGTFSAANCSGGHEP